MADSVSITPGVGAPIGVESVSGINWQAVGLHPRITTPLSEVAINCAANGDNIIVAAVGAQKIKVYAFFLMVAGAVNIKWKDGAGTDFHPALPMQGAGASWIMQFASIPWFTSAAVNTTLVLNLSGAMQVSGRLYYIQS